MRSKQFLVELPQPYAEMLEMEARNSNRTAFAHLQHILMRRWENVIRICSCGYFLYAVTDDLLCHKCGASCCPYCSTPLDGRDLCHTCGRSAGLNTDEYRGFRAAPEGKV